MEEDEEEGHQVVALEHIWSFDLLFQVTGGIKREITEGNSKFKTCSGSNIFLPPKIKFHKSSEWELKDLGLYYRAASQGVDKLKLHQASNIVLESKCSVNTTDGHLQKTKDIKSSRIYQTIQ